MSVVVTGASGHLGANLVRALLARGQSVRALVHRRAEALEGLGAELEQHRGSVCELDSLRGAFEGAELVYHLAGIVSIDGDPSGRVHEVNVGGTAKVAQACREQGARLVHVSSVHAYAMDPLDAILDESRPQVADSPEHSAYDRSKARGELAVHEQIEAGLDACIVNPTGILGPHDHGPSRLGQLVRDLDRGRMPALLEGGFDFVDARDVVAGMIAAAEQGRRGHNYVLGNRWYSIRELAEAVHAAGGARPPRLVTPAWVARLGLPFARGWSKLRSSEPLFTAESLAILASNRSISSAKARAELGYAPRPLAESIADTLAWWRSRA